LTAAEGALTKATTLGSALPRTNLTLFVPTNTAFEVVGSVFDDDDNNNNTDISKAQLSNILAYHVVPDVVEYLLSFHNISLPTLLSSEHLHIVVGEDGKIFINSAEAVIRNVLAAEGVLHVIDK
jgi:transforming growth factor-beta-induced protein